jgi:hypothetical protein
MTKPLTSKYFLVHAWIDGEFGRITACHHDFGKNYLHASITVDLSKSRSTTMISVNSP